MLLSSFETFSTKIITEDRQDVQETVCNENLSLIIWEILNCLISSLCIVGTF